MLLLFHHLDAWLLPLPILRRSPLPKGCIFYLLLNEEGNGLMKSIPHISNNSTSRMVCNGGSSLFDVLIILWNLSQVDTNW